METTCAKSIKRCIFQCAAKQGFPEISTISMGRKLVRIPLPLFWTKPITKSFYQVIKGSNVSAKALMIREKLFLDDLVIFGNTMEEILVARDFVILLLQHLGFVINFKKRILEPTQEIEFLGMMVNSKTMTLSLPQEKVQKIKSQCLEVYSGQEITLTSLFKLFSQHVFSFGIFNNNK